MIFYTSNYTSSQAGQARGGSFKGEKDYKPKKEFANMECAQGGQPARCPNLVLCVNEPKPSSLCERAFSRSMVVMCRGGDVTCFHVMRVAAG